MSSRTPDIGEQCWGIGIATGERREGFYAGLSVEGEHQIEPLTGHWRTRWICSEVHPLEEPEQPQQIRKANEQGREEHTTVGE
jgi:hypothetical protein